MGYHIGARGYLAREDSEEGKKNGNGKNGLQRNGGTNGGSNGGNGGVSEELS